MDQNHLSSVLQSAPEAHQQRCVLIAGAINDGRWGAAACYTRQAAAAAHQWASDALDLAAHCDAQTEVGRMCSVVPPTLVELTEPGVLTGQVGPATLEALEAGLMTLAHSVGREHAVQARRAMANVQRAQAVGV